MTLTAQQRRELAARAICDDRTIRNMWSGKPTKPATYERINRAAAELGLPPPPPHVPDASVTRWGM